MRGSRAAALVTSLVLLGCRGHPVASVRPADVAGTYRFAREGKTLGHTWSVRSELTLAEPDTYYLDHLITHDDADEEESETGRFRIDGDRLVLRSRKNETSDFTIRGDSLVAKMDWPGRWLSGKVGGAPVFVKVVRR